jgi:outer membrane protein insertion porin family
MQAFLTYKHEYLRVTNKEDPSIDSSLDEGLLSSVVLSFVHDARNNRFETTGGNYQSASFEFAGLGGDKNFAKWILNSRYYTRFWGDFVFRTMTEYGQIIQTTSRASPPSERFFLGGPNNMKSFQIFSLTPRRATSTGYPEPIGGSVEFLTLFELEHPIIREAGLKWVLFYDIGNAWERLRLDQFQIRQGYGFGLRWFSPIGPLRFEWGFPVKARAGEDSPVFQFFIGPPF